MSSMTGATGTPIGNMQTGLNKAPKGYKQYMNFSPEQMQLFQQLFSHVGPQSFTSRLAGGDQGAFEELEAPAMRQFQGLLGDISNRFSGTGLGGRHGSAFQMAGTQAASDFAQQLQSQRMALQRQALQDLFGMSNELFGHKPELVERQPEGWKKALGIGLPIAGAIAGGAIGSAVPGLGTAIGAQLGSSLGGGVSKGLLG